ncbi:hypothetical protein POJ06DRAFT_242688 [Lipomyces tetrasporus]|uniref:Zn(2)-C6 fungal-type domain-containing protein n=1 Tax=Lipomyces tetrasporus TaxID=54092 RepID=A0AAD7VW43_9ASCO|nr:uncharacterized protein POJ06DRAFT_242688 [Lipomyces tetrasporus]KAJ8103736.1 hypothetical protein POJ06DRAFT_242688 [Lipomyces tetrasporus]
MEMFVFPANDDGYRKRKKSFKACEQCKKGRRRCQASSKVSNGQCAKCHRDNLPCSLMTEPAATSPDAASTASNSTSMPSLTPPNIPASAPSPGIIPHSISSAMSDLPITTVITASSSLSTPPILSLQSQPQQSPSGLPQLPPVSMATSTRTSISAVMNPSDAEIKPPAEAVPADPETTSALQRRFISNLDPTSDLVMSGDPDNDRVGIFVSERGLQNSTRRHIVVPPALNSQLLTYLNTLRAFEFPGETERAGLLDIYFKYINSALPIVDRQLFMNQYAKGEHSTTLLHAIILAACRHFEAGAFLQGLKPRTFAATTHRKVQALLYAELEQDPLTLVRIYALLSMHSEGPEGLDQGAKDLAIAFHYAHTLGLHLRREVAGSSSADVTLVPKLWQSLWCLDRMSTCVNGRPMNSHPRDVGLEAADKSVEVCAVLARLTDACREIDWMIDLYRPNGPQIFPDIVLSSFRQDDPLPRLVHCVSVILSYKRVYSLTGASPETVIQALLSAALEILSILETSRDITPLPVIPYSASLTLTVFLRLYPAHEARTGWRRSCQLLDTLGRYWWIADAMSSMGRTVFRKLEDDYKAISDQLDLENRISDIFSGDGMTSSSVLDQASLFGELDKDVVDYWFPNMGLFEQFYGSAINEVTEPVQGYQVQGMRM